MGQDSGSMTLMLTCHHRRAGHVESGSLEHGAYAAMRVCGSEECIQRARWWVGDATGYGLSSARFVEDPPGYVETVRRWIAEARMRWTLEDGVAE